MLLSDIQQSDSVVHIYIYIFFFIFFSILVYYRVLNIVPCAIQYHLVVVYMYFKNQTTYRDGIGRVVGRRKREEIWGYMYMYS